MASTGVNSVTAKTKGNYFVQYSDNTLIKIFPAHITLIGTLIGDRTFSVDGKFYIVDEANDLICYIELNPDERATFSKLFSKKKSFPDYFKGFILKLSQTTFNPKDNSYTLNKNYKPIVDVHGEWTKNIYFDSEIIWDNSDYPHYDLLRQKFTLNSDSTLRDDLILLKNHQEDEASKAKIRLEEIQRKDKKLREKNKNV